MNSWLLLTNREHGRCEHEKLTSLCRNFKEDQALVINPENKESAMDQVLKVLKETVRGNFIPAFIFMGGAAMAIFQVMSMCTTPTPESFADDRSVRQQLERLGAK